MNTEHDYTKLEEAKQGIRKLLNDFKNPIKAHGVDYPGGVPTAIIVKDRHLWYNLCRYGFFEGYPVYIWPVMEDEYSILTK